MECGKSPIFTLPVLMQFQVIADNQRSAGVALYACYVARDQSIPVSAALVAHASLEACACGLAALDALHLTCAKAGGAEECITTENPTQPLFRATGMVITPLILPSLKMSYPT